MNFDPEFCRNESEVESKLIVQYLLPKLGYTPDTWHQEVTFGKIRLDFLAFAMQKIPLLVDANSPLSVVLEAKHPKQNLNRHTRRLKRYLLSLNVRYGLLTNGRGIQGARYAGPHGQLPSEREAFVALFDTEDQREGVGAFLSKRAPQWKNG